jgi:hypothetical protein
VSGHIACAWCGAFNRLDANYCQNCGHEAHRARIDCRCCQCQRQLVMDGLEGVTVEQAIEAVDLARAMQEDIDHILNAKTTKR